MNRLFATRLVGLTIAAACSPQSALADPIWLFNGSTAGGSAVIVQMPPSVDVPIRLAGSSFVAPGIPGPADRFFSQSLTAAASGASAFTSVEIAATTSRTQFSASGRTVAETRGPAGDVLAAADGYTVADVSFLLNERHSFAFSEQYSFSAPDADTPPCTPRACSAWFGIHMLVRPAADPESGDLDQQIFRDDVIGQVGEYSHGYSGFLPPGRYRLFTIVSVDQMNARGALRGDFDAVLELAGAPVPEPGTFLLLATGLLGVAAARGPIRGLSPRRQHHNRPA